MQFSDAETRARILDEVTGNQPSGAPSVLDMMRDAYGNYVVQKALDVCEGVDRARLIAAIREHLPAVRKFTYGKHIIAHIEKLEAMAKVYPSDTYGNQMLMMPDAGMGYVGCIDDMQAHGQQGLMQMQQMNAMGLHADQS
mmetsp:Transcript_5490/g.19338  ORF Transcript_5490/g.19338 Transcript_5490/m.19338 type:complete len:140 (-) Transcript_5490:412-831(-)